MRSFECLREEYMYMQSIGILDIIISNVLLSPKFTAHEYCKVDGNVATIGMNLCVFVYPFSLHFF